MDKNAIIVNDVVELALIELQYIAADFSQRRESTSDLLERAALDIQLPNIQWLWLQSSSLWKLYEFHPIDPNIYRAPLRRGDVASPDYCPALLPRNRQLPPLRLCPQRVNEQWEAHAAPSQNAAPSTPDRTTTPRLSIPRRRDTLCYRRGYGSRWGRPLLSAP